MNKKRSSFLFLFFALLLSRYGAMAQHQEVQEKPGMWKGSERQAIDSTSLLYAFKNGKAEGHFRYFFSATDNNDRLTDYYANAFGGGLRYETAPFHHLQVGISGFYVFNIGSSDLALRDSITSQVNRYEIGLFDIEDAGNKNDIDRLEEFYVKYTLRSSYLRFGRQLINTPFINLQDGRMRPTGAEGAWFELNEIKNLHLEGGWLYAVSPRSTVRWYSTANSAGIYPMGVTVDGKKSDYKGNISSSGAFMLGARFKAAKWVTVSAWDLFFENVHNTALLQTDFNTRYKDKLNLLGALQFIRQDAINNGGNADPAKTYISKGASAMTAGARAGIKYRNLELTLNYNRIFKNGRYLMPREWGREPFFTFLPRERNEGLGDVHAVMGKILYTFPKQRITAAVAAGYYKLPDTQLAALNKYGMPSYTQVNADVRYAFGGVLKGLDAQLLVVSKFNNGDLHGDKRFEFNKVNMGLYNLVINYHF